MRNEKYILAVITIILFSNKFLCAQSYVEDTGGKVSLNIVLHPIQTIMINPSHNSVDLEYLSKEDYKNGVVSNQSDHLIVYSTGGFEVNVGSEREYLVGDNEGISSSGIKITASKGGNNDLLQVVYEDNVVLSNTGSRLLRSKTGGVDQTFNVRYQAEGNDAYINHFESENGGPAIYTAMITYSIVSQ